MDSITIGTITYPLNKNKSINKIALRKATHKQLKTLLKTSHSIRINVEDEFIRRYKQGVENGI